MDWISVDDGLPEDDTPSGEWIVAKNKDGPFPAKYHNGNVPYFENLLEVDRDGDTEWYWLDGKWAVTHWMPQPKPPTADQGQLHPK